MALKALLLKKQIDQRRKQLTELLNRRTAHEAREVELTRDIDEVETAEQCAEVEGRVSEFETERDEIEQAIANLNREIEGLENDLAAEEQAQDTTTPAQARAPAGENNTRDQL